MRFLFYFSSTPSSLGTTWIEAAQSIIQELRRAQRDPSPRLGTPERHGAEFLWRRASHMEGYDTCWVPHRVVRRGQQSVLVEGYPFVECDNVDELARTRRKRTYWISRNELERFGVARVRSRKIAFFTSPHATRESVATIESLLRLELWFPFTEHDLRQSYMRRAMRVHPDAGGNEEKFLQLQHDQERAAAVLNHPANAS